MCPRDTDARGGPRKLTLVNGMDRGTKTEMVSGDMKIDWQIARKFFDCSERMRDTITNELTLSGKWLKGHCPKVSVLGKSKV